MATLRAQLAEQVERLEALLDRLPDVVAKETKTKIAELRRLLLQQRAPRLVLVGRRGSGKSSLVNALFGREVAEVGHESATTGTATWFTYRDASGTLEVLDTRGLQEGAAPAEADGAATPLDSILAELRDKSPDAVLFLVKAKEVDAAIQTDLELLAEICGEVTRLHRFKVPVVSIVTHCDELEPKAVKLHQPEDEDPADLREKLERVKKVEAIIERYVRDAPRLKDHHVRTIGVCTYQSWRRDGKRRADERWRIDELVSFLVDELPQETLVEMARLTRVATVQRAIAHRMTLAVAGACAGVAATPIPIADIGPITGLQVSLISGIAYVTGRQVGVKAAAEFMAALGINVGTAFALREAARALVKFVFPGAGGVVSAAVAYAGTMGIGRAATAYYLDDLSAEEAAQVFEKERGSELRNDEGSRDAAQT
ncbi:MAG: GTPase family protein [Myxococcota bacterium]